MYSGPLQKMRCFTASFRGDVKLLVMEDLVEISLWLLIMEDLAFGYLQALVSYNDGKPKW